MGGVRGRVLILGGTARGRELASTLAAEGIPVIYSLAGVVRRPLLPDCPVRFGPFPAGLADWLRAEGIKAVVTATHPFARAIAAEAYAAWSATGIPTVLLRRPGWRAVPGDDWHWADSLEHAAELAEDLGRRILVTTGARSLAAFSRSRRWLLIRTVEPPDGPPPANARLIQARGPFSIESETALLREYRIDLVVTKDSGADCVSAKLTAARHLGIPVVVVRRPEPPPLPVRESAIEILSWLHR